MSIFKTLFQKKEIAPSKIETKGSFPNESYSMYTTNQGFVYAFENYSIDTILQNYASIAPLAAAVDKLANAVASLPITLVDKESQTPKKTHPAYKLLRNPNMEFQKTKQQLLRAFVTWYILDGDVYLMKTGVQQPRELYILPSNSVTHVPDERGFTKQLWYTGYGSTKVYTKSEFDGFFHSEDGLQHIIHIANFNPRQDQLEGRSEIASLYYEINQYLHTGAHNLNLLRNGVRPSGAFVLKAQNGEPAVLTDDQFDTVKQRLLEGYAGAANAGKALILDGGFEWQQMSMSPKDLDFATLKQQAEEAIYKKLDIPVQLVSSQRTTAGNMSSIRLEFYQNRVIPLAEDILDYFDKFLLGSYRDSAQLEFIVDKDEIDVLMEYRVGRRKAIETSTTLTINEKRKIFKEPDIEGGNKIVDPNGRPIAGPDANFVVGDTNAEQTPKPPTVTPNAATGI